MASDAMAPSANWSDVIAPSAMSAVATPPSAIFAESTAPSARSTVATVPSRIFAESTAPSAKSAVAIVPSAIFAESTAPSAKSAVAIVPSAIFAESTAVSARSMVAMERSSILLPVTEASASSSDVMALAATFSEVTLAAARPALSIAPGATFSEVTAPSERFSLVRLFWATLAPVTDCGARASRCYRVISDAWSQHGTGPQPTGVDLGRGPPRRPHDGQPQQEEHQGEDHRSSSGRPTRLPTDRGLVPSSHLMSSPLTASSGSAASRLFGTSQRRKPASSSECHSLGDVERSRPPRVGLRDGDVGHPRPRGSPSSRRSVPPSRTRSWIFTPEMTRSLLSKTLARVRVRHQILALTCTSKGPTGWAAGDTFTDAVRAVPLVLSEGPSPRLTRPREYHHDRTKTSQTRLPHGRRGLYTGDT